MLASRFSNKFLETSANDGILRENESGKRPDDAENQIHSAWLANRIQGLAQANATLRQGRQMYGAMSFDTAQELANRARELALRATVPESHYRSWELIVAVRKQLSNTSFTTDEAAALLKQVVVLLDEASSAFNAKHFDDAENKANQAVKLLEDAKRLEVSILAEKARKEMERDLLLYGSILAGASLVGLILARRRPRSARRK